MNKKKWLVAGAGVLMTFSLAACGQSSKTVATTDGGKITQEQYYNKMKKTTQGKQVLQQMILNKVLEKDYGKDIKQSQVNAQFNNYKKQYGSQFSAMLQQQGMTESQLKDSIKDNLLLKQAVLHNTSFTDKDLQNQFKSFQPKVTVQEITVKDETKGQSAIADLQSGKSFKDTAKQYAADKKAQTVSFDNSNKSVDPAAKKAAFKLKKGQYTEQPVKLKQGYAVIKMIDKPSKGKWQDHRAELKDQLVTKRMSNQSTLHSVVSKVLRDGDVHIEDSSLKNILADYVKTPNN